MRYLNLGCGARHATDAAWTNVDFHAGPGVLGHDLLRRLPFPDRTFDVVYHSHVLEHLPHAEAPRFLAECLRVLVPGGVLRVVVPDLEGICRAYLKSLEEAEEGKPGAHERHEWMVVEMYDQAVRTVSGGEMQRYLHNPDPFVASRVGRLEPPPRTGTLARAFRKLRRAWASIWLTASEREAFFRASGEIHRWMYDRHSLRVLLEACGFTGVRRCSATDSGVPGWDAWHLDRNADGSEHAPSSIYVEAKRP